MISAAFWKSQAGLPFLMQRGDTTADKVSPNHFQGEVGGDEAMNSGGGSHELLVIGFEIALVVAIERWSPANLAKRPWVLLHNPAPSAPPFIPPLLLASLRIHTLARSPRDPSNAARNGVPWLDTRGEVVAKECRVWCEI